MFAQTDMIISWLLEQCQEASKSGFVVGISGGIDSAVASTFSALTKKPTYAISMPINQEEEQKNRADEHISWLTSHFKNVQGYSVDLTSTFKTFNQDLPPGISEIALANTRSRLRMCTLYAIAGSRDLLVVGTGNKVEDFGTGFFTKYGDGGVDISPLGDLTKTQVYEAAESLGIRESIRKAVPTDGLWGDNRTDEQQLGCTYPELEEAMAFCEDQGFETFSSFKHSSVYGFIEPNKRNIIETYLKRHQANCHKMRMPPICRI